MVTVLPDGSAFAILEMPLPDNHWLYEKKNDFEVPPMLMRMGTTDPRRKEFEAALRQAGKYALRNSVFSPDEVGFDPDALLQNLIVGLLGYHTPNGLSRDEWANPPEGKQAQLFNINSGKGSSEQSTPGR